MKQEIKDKTEYIILWEAIRKLESDKEYYSFFRDLCTIQEMKDMLMRIKIVKDLNQGKDYRTIAKKYSTSTTTVTRVSNWLHHGEGGYRLVLDKLKDIQH